MSGGHKTLTVGVISDTHGLLRPEAVEVLQGVDHILHAGDVGSAAILDALRQLAPLTAIRGNVDVSGVCAALPATEAVEFDGHLFYLVHSLTDIDIKPEIAGVSAVIYGHSHRASIRQEDVLYLNPGSAGPRRFDLAVTLAKIEIADGRLRASIIEL
jgi:uncharacterized protein